MNPTTLKMKWLIIDTTTNGTAWFAAIASWQQELDIWIKVVAGLSAIALSWITIYIKVKNYNKGKE